MFSKLYSLVGINTALSPNMVPNNYGPTKNAAYII